MLGSPKPKKILVPSTIVPRYIFSGIASLPNPTHSFNFLDALEKEKLTPFWYFLLCLFFHNFHFINPLFFLTFHNISYERCFGSFFLLHFGFGKKFVRKRCAYNVDEIDSWTQTTQRQFFYVDYLSEEMKPLGLIIYFKYDKCRERIHDLLVATCFHLYLWRDYDWLPQVQSRRLRQRKMLQRKRWK